MLLSAQFFPHEVPMYGRIVLPTALTVALLAACSKPESKDPTVPASKTRDLQLVESPAAEARGVSDLEAGTRIPLARPSAHRASAPAVPQPEALPVEAPAPLLAPRVTSGSPVRGEMSLVSMPAAPTRMEAGSSAGTMDGDRSGGREPGSSRGPMVIIRGGLGSPRDDCKIHGPGGLGGFGGGILVNRTTPPMRGTSSPRFFPGPVRIR